VKIYNAPNHPASLREKTPTSSQGRGRDQSWSGVAAPPWGTRGGPPDRGPPGSFCAVSSEGEAGNKRNEQKRKCGTGRWRPEGGGFSRGPPVRRGPRTVRVQEDGGSDFDRHLQQKGINHDPHSGPPFIPGRAVVGDKKNRWRGISLKNPFGVGGGETPAPLFRGRERGDGPV